MKGSFNLRLLMCFLLHHACAFNITQILTQYPDFSSLNHYLTQTGLASTINSRETITILALDNASLSPLSGKTTPQLLSNILSVHVVLDYFDLPKLQKLPDGPTTLTTLFQTTGLARGQQGFLNVTRLTTGSISFGSAVAGSPPAQSNLVKSVFSQPYNISVLQVSNVIVSPEGVNGHAPSAGPEGGDSGAHQPPVGAPLAGGGSHAPSGAVGGGWSRGPSASPRASPPMVGEGPMPSGAAPGPGMATTPVAGPTSVAEGPVADAVAGGEVPASNSPSMATGLRLSLGVVCLVMGTALRAVSAI